MNTATAAAAYLAHEEGYSPRAVWDVNAWRIGYGSDTITDAAGNVRQVQQGDTTTEEAARRDLIRRISTEFIPKIQRKIGADVFNRWPQPAQIAFISFAYNYGNLKKSIAEAAKTLNPEHLAKIWISSTYNDNQRLPENIRQALRARRQREAALILSGSETVKKKMIIPALGLTL